MKTAITASCALGLILALAAVAVAQDKDAKTYEIKLHRTAKVGDKFHISAECSEHKKMTGDVGGKPRKNEDSFSAEAEGVLEVLAADRGSQTKVALKLDRCVKIDGEKRTELAPKGTVVIVEHKDGKKVVTPKDPNLPLSKDAARAIESLIDVSQPGKPASDDDVFGTSQKKKVGDTWPINAEAAAKDAALRLPGAKKEDFSGQVKLRGLKTVSGVPCLEIAVDMRLKDFPPAPPGMKIVMSQGKFTMVWLVPVDPSITLGKGELQIKVTQSLKGTTKDGQEVAVEVAAESSLKRQTVPLKK